MPIGVPLKLDGKNTSSAQAARAHFGRKLGRLIPKAPRYIGDGIAVDLAGGGSIRHGD